MKGLLVLLAAGAGAAIYFLSKKSDDKAPDAGSANQPAPETPELKGSEVGPIAFVFTDPKFTASVAEKVRQAVQVKYLIDGGKNIRFFVARTTNHARFDPKATLTGAQKYFTMIVGLVPPVLRRNMSAHEVINILLQAAGADVALNEKLILIIPPAVGNVLDRWLEDLQLGRPEVADAGETNALCRLLRRGTPITVPVDKNGQYVFDESAKERILKAISGKPIGLPLCEQHLASKNA